MPIVPIENGGTGANNAEDARANLTAAKIGHYFARATWSDYGYHVTIPEITELFDGTIVTIETDSANPNTGYLQINDLEKIKLFKRSSRDTYKEAILDMDIYWIGAKAIITFVLINHSYYGRIFLPIQTIPSRRDIGGVQRASRITVGTSTNGWTYADCDSLCDGTNDTTVINNAIEKLPTTGGEIIILDGTYNLTGPINVNKSNITLSGNGQSTILKRNFNGSSVLSGLIYVTSNNNTIKFLALDGNKTTYSDTKNNGIFINYNTSNNMVTGVVCNNDNVGIYVNNSGRNRVIANICRNNNHGITLSSASASNNVITGNICSNNSEYGIYSVSSSNNTITGNTCSGNNRGIYIYGTTYITVVGNTCNNNTTTGIYLYNTKNSAVTGNTCNNNDCGINVNLSDCNTISGNTCIRENGETSDYTTGQYTIYLSYSDNNLIIGNNIMGKNYNSGSDSTNNTFANNKYN